LDLRGGIGPSDRIKNFESKLTRESTAEEAAMMTLVNASV
jgi:hypothetical protein